MMLVPAGEVRLNETFDSMEEAVSLGVYYAQIVAAKSTVSAHPPTQLTA